MSLKRRSRATLGACFVSLAQTYTTTRQPPHFWGFKSPRIVLAPTTRSLPLESPPRGLGRGRAADALLVAAARLEPLLSRELELAVELFAGVLAVDEVAEPPADAAFARVEAAAGLAEVGHRAELAVDGARGVPPAVELVAGFLGGFFVLEARVDVADEVYTNKVSKNV